MGLEDILLLTFSVKVKLPGEGHQLESKKMLETFRIPWFSQDSNQPTNLLVSLFSVVDLFF